VNISSPNTKNLRDLQSDAALDALLSAIAQRREELAQHHAIFDDAGNKLPKRTPIFLKIAPDLEPDQISVIAATLLRHGIDGVIATNTTLSRDAVRGMSYGDEAGGLSGAPVREASNAVIRQLRAALGPHYPIIGVGGIMSAQDAIDKRQAGADLVQIYTGLIYKGPALIKEVAQTLAQGR
jgi:dihydroorotate dehydrogenase